MKSIKYLVPLVGLLPILAFADEQTSSAYEEVIVTATRSEKPISEVLSVSTLITREDIDRLQSKDVFDLLSREAGVAFTRNGGRGSQTSLMLRGNQSDHTLFLVDGVRVGSATSGGASLAGLNMDLVDRVEIVRGPKSALYGADAIGGVVNLITRTSAQAERAQAASISAEYGSNATRDISMVGALQGDAYSLSLVGALYETDGIDNTSDKTGVNGDDDGFKNRSTALNYGLEMTDDLDLRLSYNRNEATSDYDTNCSDNTTFLPVDCQIYTESLMDTFSAGLDYQVSDRFRALLQLGHSQDQAEEFARNMDISTTFNGGVFNTRRKEASLVGFIDLSSSHQLTAGLDYSSEEVDSSTEYTIDSRDNRAAFMQLESTYDRVSLNFGLRHDDNEQFGSKTTASVQSGYAINDNLRLVASYAEGFKAPTFNDLYYPGFGNPDFIPEESKNYELALQGQAGVADYYIAAYQNDVQNLIQYNSDTFTTDQVSEAQTQGLEFDVDLALASWQLGIAGSHMNPKNELTGMTLRRRPEQTFSVDIDKQQGKASYGISVRAESHRYDDASENLRMGGYGLVDLRAAYALTSEWSVKGRVNNLLDKQYTTAYSFSLGEYQSVGRELFVSVTYRPGL